MCDEKLSQCWQSENTTIKFIKKCTTRTFRVFLQRDFSTLTSPTTSDKRARNFLWLKCLMIQKICFASIVVSRMINAWKASLCFVLFCASAQRRTLKKFTAINKANTGRLICCINMTHGWIYRGKSSEFFLRLLIEIIFHGATIFMKPFGRLKGKLSGCLKPSNPIALHQLTPRSQPAFWNLRKSLVVSQWHNATFRWNLTAISSRQLSCSSYTVMSPAKHLFRFQLTFMLRFVTGTFVKKCLGRTLSCDLRFPFKSIESKVFINPTSDQVWIW